MRERDTEREVGMCERERECERESEEGEVSVCVSERQRRIAKETKPVGEREIETERETVRDTHVFVYICESSGTKNKMRVSLTHSHTFALTR